MNGICAGLADKTKIYDVIIPEICHQHDFGKWTEDGFKHEPSHIQIDHSLKIKIEHLIKSDVFNTSLSQGIVPMGNELPENMNAIKPKCILTATSREGANKSLM